MTNGDPGVRIRDSLAHETEAIEQLTLTAYAEYAAAVTPEFWSAYRRNIAEAIRLRLPGERVVAEATGSGRLLGSVLLIPAAHSAADADVHGRPEARLLAVDPAARGRGIGRALMTECIRRARAAGAAALYLHTTESMRTALGMYERMGFVRVPRHDFSPAADVLVKGYRLALGEAPASAAAAGRVGAGPSR